MRKILFAPIEKNYFTIKINCIKVGLLKNPTFIFLVAIMKEINSPVTDKELIVASCNGSEEAFRRLYEKYWKDLYKIAYRRLPSEEDVKDVLQETFISLWKNIHHLSVDESIGKYLYVALRNKIFNYYEKKQLRLKKLMNQPFHPVESEDHIYSVLDTKELRVAINAIIDDMPQRMREIYLLSKEVQLTNAEIANLLLLAPQTIKNQVHHALSRIRNELSKTHLHLLFFWI
ncbi:MAG: sigma-70 family RNA polymerase sigma factor [Rhizobacter sp.]|nr:sigma-70 family RNA polymerase sigma factor [Ferruginibacter sp.]